MPTIQLAYSPKVGANVMIVRTPVDAAHDTVEIYRADGRLVGAAKLRRREVRG